MSLPNQNTNFMAHMPNPQGQGWHARAVRAAVARVQEMGLPSARDEYWKFTTPAAFLDSDPKHSGAAPKSDIFRAIDCINLRCVDGVLSGADLGSVDGLEITPLSQARGADIHWAADLYGTLEAADHARVQRPFAAVNTAIASEGLLIHVLGKIAKPLRIIYETTGAQVNLHHVVKLDEGASFTLLEEGVIGANSTCVMEGFVSDSTNFTHLRIQPAHNDRTELTHIYGRLGQGSALQSFTLTVDGAMTRNEVVLDILGDDASAHIAGACLGNGDFHHDDTVFIMHDAVNCESRQVFKKVLRNGATGVFQGKILVQPGAQKTDGYQISQSLLLDDDSQFLAKPELEIYADDVACSHGSTSGAIDEQALFYLRSRGVPVAAATNLLTLSFMAEALEEIEDEALAEVVLDYLTHAMGAAG